MRTRAPSCGSATTPSSRKSPGIAAGSAPASKRIQPVTSAGDVSASYCGPLTARRFSSTHPPPPGTVASAALAPSTPEHSTIAIAARCSGLSGASGARTPGP